MAMNPPGGGQDDLVVKTKVEANASQAEKAGQADAEAYTKGFQKGAQKAPIPGGAAAPGRESAAGSIYEGGGRKDWRNGPGSGNRSAPAMGAGDVLSGTTAVPAGELEKDPRTPARIRASERRIASQQQSMNQRAMRDEERAARQQQTVAERDSRRQQTVAEREERQASKLDADMGWVGVQREERYRKDAERTRRQDDAAYFRYQRRQQLQEERGRARQERIDARIDDQINAISMTRDEKYRRTRERDAVRAQRQGDASIWREEQGISAPGIIEGDRGGRLPPDLAASQGVIGPPPGRFGRASQAASQSMRGGFSPGLQALTYGMSAVGQAILLAGPMMNSVEGGAFGDLPLVGGALQGDIQMQRGLIGQQDQERRAQAALTYQRSLYGTHVQREALTTAQGREAQAYGLETSLAGRAGTRESADYARGTVALQRQALVDQRAYARANADLETRRTTEERNYGRQVEDTQHQRMILERNFVRQYQDFARQRSDVELRSTRQREDVVRQLTDETIRHTRQQQDIVRQRETLGIGYSRQQQDFARQRETLGIGYARSSEDLAISSGRAEEDYSRQRARTQQDIADNNRIRQIESKTLLRDERNQLSDISMQQFQSIGGLIGAAGSGDPFAIMGALYRMKQLRQEKQIVQGNVSRGGFTEVQQAQNQVQNRQQQNQLVDLDREHARQQQDISLAQKRNEEDYKRGLDEIGIQQKRSVEDYKRGLEELDIQARRADEDRARALDALGVQWKRISEDEGRSLSVLDQQQKRFYEDYRDNLSQIALAEKRHWEDYTENVRLIALAQTRAAQDRVSQIQQEMAARSALDVAHARALEDLGTQQQKLDIAHAQATQDFAKQDLALYVAQTQAAEDYRITMDTINRERKQQEVALGKEMRQMWEQLAISVGLAGIFSAQIVGSVKYLATFLRTLFGGGAAVAGAAGEIGGDVAIGASQMGKTGAAAAGTESGGLMAVLAGIGLSPVAIDAVAKIIRENAPGFAGFGFGGATPAQAAEIQQGVPGGYSPMGNAQGTVQGSQSSAYGSAGVPPNPMNTHTGGEPGGYSGLGADNNGTIQLSGVATAGGETTPGGVPITTNANVVAAFGQVSGYTEKVKQDFADTGGTADGIQKRFTDSYAYAEGIKSNMGQAASYAVDFKNTVAGAGASFASAVAGAMGAGDGGAGRGNGTQGQTGGSWRDTAQASRGPDNSAIREQMMKSYGNPRGGLLPEWHGKNVPFGPMLNYKYVTPTYSGSGVGDASVSQDSGAGTAGASSTMPRATPYPYGFHSAFYGQNGITSDDVASLKVSLDGLTGAIRTNGPVATSRAALNHHITQTMSGWLGTGMVG